MLQTYRDFVDRYLQLSENDKSVLKQRLFDAVHRLGAAGGNFPPVFALMLSERENAPLFTEALSNSDDRELLLQLRKDYEALLYAYRKRMALLCDMCLDDYSLRTKFFAGFTSMENLAPIAELLSVNYGTLRALHKKSSERSHTAKLRSCAVKLKLPTEALASFIEELSH